MIWQNLVVLAIFVGVCGFIAYAGDLLGRRMGKRRLTLFGMRPRYTAVMTTTVTGMLIAAFTITIMAMTSKDMRDLALRGAAIIHESKKAAKEVIQQRSIATRARQEAKDAIRQLDSLDEDIAKLKENLSRNEAALARAEKNLTTSKKEIVKRRTEIAKLKQQQDKLKHDLSTLLFEMGEAASKWPKYIALRQETIIFRSNEEMARRVIRCAQSKNEIRAELFGLINEADKRAKDEGAKTGENGRTIEVLPKKIVTGNAGQGRFLKESESIDALIDNISRGSGSVVVRIVSVGNSVKGEQALIEFALNYNELVYRSGDEVASAIIDGRSSRGQIFGNLIMFLRNEVRSTAITKGVIPSYDEEGNPSVGQIAWDEIFDLVDHIKTTGKSVRVKAFAADETLSAGPLNLKLVVSDSP